MAHKNKTNWSPYKARKQTFKTKAAALKKEQTALGITPEPTKSRHKKPEKIFTLEEANDRIYDIFRNHEFADFPHEKRRQLAAFYVLLMNEQMDHNFTRLVTLRDVAIRHFIDSLIVTRLTQLQFPLMDVGTGPGLPGIPLKIHFAKEPMILAEGVGKRCDFLRRAIDEMKLKNIEVLQKNIRSSLSEPQVKGVITRAVEDIRNTLTNVNHVLAPGGRVYFMKGPNVDPELKMAEAMLKQYKLIEDHAYDLPKTTHKRRLIVYEKLGD